MKARLTKDGSPGVIEFELPNPRPEPGEVYVWTVPCRTAGNHDFNIGDIIELIEMTFESPHGYHCSSGNWRCRTKFGVSVWTSVEDSIYKGWLKKNVPVRTVWERLQEA